jgi:MATE family multidrug resistance protein
MAILLGGLILKVPFNALFMYGGAPIGLDAIPPMGGAGCAVSTACIAWIALAAAIYLLSHDAQYRRMGLWPWRLGWPEPDRLRELLRQGIPTGLSYLIEVTSFTFIALFVARFGAVVGASHQIVANLAALTYMVPLSIANATSTLTARALGAGDPTQARRASILGLQMALTTGILITVTILLGKSQILWAYSNDPTVIAAALPLIIWIGIFHLFDAAQTVLSFSLRAYQVSTLPMGIYAVSLWGIGLGGGAWLTFGDSFGAPTAYFAGALGFWVATTAGLALAAALLGWLQWRVWQQTAPTSTV